VSTGTTTSSASPLPPLSPRLPSPLPPGPPMLQPSVERPSTTNSTMGRLTVNLGIMSTSARLAGAEQVDETTGVQCNGPLHHGNPTRRLQAQSFKQRAEAADVRDNLHRISRRIAVVYPAFSGCGDARRVPAFV